MTNYIRMELNEKALEMVHGGAISKEWIINCDQCGALVSGRITRALLGREWWYFECPDCGLKVTKSKWK